MGRGRKQEGRKEREMGEEGEDEAMAACWRCRWLCG